MQINDINQRIKRVYNSIDKRYDDQIANNVSISHNSSDGGVLTVGISFGGKKNDTEKMNIIFNVISAIAGLKDHVKNTFEEAGKNPQEVENVINDHKEMQILIDLWNADKHGYPVKRKRSGLDPKIQEAEEGLVISDFREGSGSVSFQISADPKKTKFTNNQNTSISINANVVDKNDEYICNLDQIIDVSLEQFIKLINETGS